MASKLGIAEEEADESRFWLEVLAKVGALDAEAIKPLHKEFSEILAMLVASRKTLRTRIKESGSVLREDRAEYYADPESAIGNPAIENSITS